MFKRLIASLSCIAFIFSNFQQSQAQDFSVSQLPVPGTMVRESAPLVPLSLKGMIVDPQNPLKFQFLVDTGNSNVIPADQEQLKQQANQLVKYFLAGLTIPEGDLWVNLSPYEKDRMVPEALGKTQLGRDLLAQDYILKQLTASLIYPEKDLGKEFWSRVYQQAQAQFGTTDVPVNTFNKVWILPDHAQVFENGDAAYVTQSSLKVMLDEDYLALQKHSPASAAPNNTHSIGANIVRKIVLPEIEKEVNTGRNFAPLRQIYQALILAKWYKETVQNGLLDTVYTNKKKVAGIDLNDPRVKEQIYQRYLQAYKKGVFNYIKEDPTPDGRVTPRKYFSGGLIWKMKLGRTKDPAMVGRADGAILGFTVTIVAAKAQQDAAMFGYQGPQKKRSALTLTDVALNWIWKKKREQKEQEDLKAQKEQKKGRYEQRKFKLIQNLPRQNVETLVEWLNSEDEDLVVAVIKELADRGDKRAMVPLAQKMNGGPFNVREAMIVALKKLGADKEFFFQANLKDIPNLAAIEWLGNSGDRRAIDPLTKFLDYDDAFQFTAGKVRVALSKLARYPDDRYKVALLGLKSPKVDNNIWAVKMLEGPSQRNAASKELSGYIKDGYSGEYAFKALQELGADQEIIFEIGVPSLRSHDSITVLAAMEALGEANAGRAVSHIEQFLNIPLKNDLDYKTYNAASRILHKAGDVREKYFYNYSQEEGAEKGVWEKVRYEDKKDFAMLNSAQNGGIDLNQMDLKSVGKTIHMQFDPDQLNEFMQGGFIGFTPVIISITPINSPLSLLGIDGTS